MIKRLIKTQGYGFIVQGGTDHLEGNQYKMDQVLGKNVIHFYAKQGGVLWIMFVGKLSTVKKGIILKQIEDKCEFVFYKDEDVYFKSEYELNLKSIFGSDLVIE